MVVVRAMAPAPLGWEPKVQVPRSQQGAVLALALCSFLLGLAALLPFDVAQIGRSGTLAMGAAMIGSATLAAVVFDLPVLVPLALGVPLLLLLACVFPRLRRRLPALFALAPLPALAAALLAGAEPELVLGNAAFALTLRARCAGRDAARRGLGAVDPRRRLCRALAARAAAQRRLHRQLADDADRLRRRLPGGRPDRLLLPAGGAERGCQRPGAAGRGAGGLARQRALSRAGAAGRGLPAGRPAAAGPGHAGRQPADPRRRRGVARIALARSHAAAADRRPRHEGRPGAAAFLDAAGLRRGADPGRGRDERRRGQGQHHGADPLPAARHRAARVRPPAGRGRSVRRPLRRRDRPHAGPAEADPGLLQRQPDGLPGGGDRHGPGRGRGRHGAGRGLLCGAPPAGEGGAVPRRGRGRAHRPPPSVADAAAGGRHRPGARRPAADRRRAGQVRGQGPDGQRPGRHRGGAVVDRHHAC